MVNGLHNWRRILSDRNTRPKANAPLRCWDRWDAFGKGGGRERSRRALGIEGGVLEKHLQQQGVGALEVERFDRGGIQL